MKLAVRFQQPRIRVQIDRLFASVLVSDKLVVDPETNLEVRQPLSQEEIERIETLVKDSIGFDEERGDSVTVKSAEFVDTLMAAAVPWYEKSWFEEISRQITTILILSIVALGVMRPFCPEFWCRLVLCHPEWLRQLVMRIWI